MNNPKTLLYSPSHEWLRVDGEEATLGITNFAQEALGDITYVDLPVVGDEIAVGEECGSIESVKAASEIYAPASGEVIAVNDKLDSTPGLVNSSPFKDGWMLKIRLFTKSEKLMKVDAYEEHCAKEAH